MVFYINMCIAHAKIFIYFTPGNHFKTVGFFVQRTGYRSNRTGLPAKPVETDWTKWNLKFKFEFEFDWFYRFPVKPDQFTGTGRRRFHQNGREKKPWL